MALKPLISLVFRHKKRRPWTSLVDQMVGRGDLNPRLALIISGLQPKSWHKAVICRDAGMNVPFLDHLKQLYRL